MASINESSGSVLSGEEIERITEAMKDVRFRKLLQEYTEEIGNSENLRRYEEELCLLEKERGFDARFLYPEGGYVLKTAAIDAPVKVVFINISKNSHVDKPSYSRSETDNKGLNWSVPYILAPPRQDKDENGKKCDVYDVIFNPDTLYMASKNNQFRKMIEETALDGVEEQFSVILNREKISYPKFSFKGSINPTIIRKCSLSSESSSPVEDMETFLSNKMKSACTIGIPSHNSSLGVVQKPTNSPVTPEYSIKYQQNIRLDNYDVVSLQSANIRPTAVVVDIHLPHLHSADQLILDVSNQALTLSSCEPSPSYRLKINLTFPVCEKGGNAQFDTDTRHLIVTLPVIPYEAPENEGFRIESVSEEQKLHQCDFGFCDCSEKMYKKPPFCFNQTEDIIVILVNVPHINKSSVNVNYCECGSSLKLEFYSIANGDSPDNNMLYIRFSPNNVIMPSSSAIDVSSENLVLRFVKSFPAIWNTFSSSGCDQAWIENKFPTRKTVLGELDNLQKGSESLLKDSRSLENSDVHIKNISEDDVSLNVEVSKLELKSRHLERETISGDNNQQLKPRNDSESSEENTRKRGILKYPHNWRSFSESSDEPETLLDFQFSDAEGSSENLTEKSKKMVRFNDNVSRNIFRPNSSILGQKRKNQKRSQQKKKSITRQRSSGSESEPSEVGDSNGEVCSSSFSDSELGAEDADNRPSWKNLSPISEKSSPSENTQKSQSNEKCGADVQGETLDFRTSKDVKDSFETLDFRTRKSSPFDRKTCDISSSPYCDSIPEFQESKQPNVNNTEMLDFRTNKEDSCDTSANTHRDGLTISDAESTTVGSINSSSSTICKKDGRRFRKSKKQHPKKQTCSIEPDSCKADDTKTGCSTGTRKRKGSEDTKMFLGKQNQENCTKIDPRFADEDVASSVENDTHILQEGWTQVNRERRTRRKKSQKQPDIQKSDSDTCSRMNEFLPSEEPNFEFTNVMFELD